MNVEITTVASNDCSPNVQCGTSANSPNPIASPQQLNINTLYDSIPVNNSTETNDCNEPQQLNNSALAQLLDYGVSDTEDSESDSDTSSNSDSVKEKPDADGVEVRNERENSANMKLRKGDVMSTDTSTASEYESDASSTYSDVGACGVSTTVAPEKKPATLRTKGEITLDELPPIEELKINVREEECVEIGVVSSVIEQLVIVQSHRGTPAYDIDTLLFLDHGNRPLGRVFDVLGPVTEPFYAVRFNTHEQAVATGVLPGTPVFSAPRTSHTSYVFVSELVKMKGSDASWEHNNEPPELYLDYSDDEQERQVRRLRREARNHSSSSSLERNRKFEKQMNDKNLLMTERYKNQQQQHHQPQPHQHHAVAFRKRRPPQMHDMRRTPIAIVPSPQPQPPPAAWMLPPATLAPRPPDFWSTPAPPFQFLPYGTPVHMFPPQTFVGRIPPQPSPAAVFTSPPPFNPSIPPPRARPTAPCIHPRPPMNCFGPNPPPRWMGPPPGLGMMRRPPPPRPRYGSYTKQ